MYGQLVFCVSGIYIFFLTWGILQERISTQLYTSPEPGVPDGKYRYFLFMNVIQCIIAAITSLIFLKVVGSGGESKKNDRGSSKGNATSAASTLSHGAVQSAASSDIIPRNKRLLWEYFCVACCATISSPFGYQSLKHLNYPTMILGKSCKLVPVMLMNVLLHRKRFEPYKYFTVFLITVGVSGFMLFEDREEASSAKPNSIFGLVLLLINLLLDGVTNSWQDAIFSKYRVRAQHMMFFMNAFSAMLLGTWLCASPLSDELANAISFVRTYPAALYDVALFALCGAMGQNFIFYTIEKFGSLSLVTVTVTRKLFTILISLFYFNHRLNGWQWASVCLVFVALWMETQFKRGSSHKSSSSSNHAAVHKDLREAITSADAPSAQSFTAIVTSAHDQQQRSSASSKITRKTRSTSRKDH